MKITAINGSPKAKDSLSGRIIGQMEKLLGTKAEVHQAVRLTSEGAAQDVTALLNTDILLIVFPLYVDSLPAPLTELLTRLRKAATGCAAKPRVYAIVNCGFYEAEQNAVALRIVRHFAEDAGLPFGYGIGIGHGGMLASFGDDWRHGPPAAVYRALSDMAEAMRKGESGPEGLVPDVFTGPNFPRVLYYAAANFSWRKPAKQNSALKKMRARPYAKEGV